MAGVIGCALLFSAAACEEHHVDAHAMAFELEPGLRLPVAYTGMSDDGKSVTITTTMQMGSMTHDMSGAFEPLEDGAVYRAWAKGEGAWTDLGVFEPSEDLIAEAGDGDLLQVTVESAGTPAAPSEVVVVAGEAGGTLAFGALSAKSFTPAAVEATIDDGSILLEFSGLPELPPGYVYELWNVTTDEDGAAQGDPVALGALGESGHGELSVEGVELADHHVLEISIEADRGAAGRSSLVCFVSAHGHDADETAHGHQP